MSAFLHQLTDWYLSVLDVGGYWAVAALMILESTLIPIPSETIIPPAAYLAHTQGHLSVAGVVLAGTAGSVLGASLMYWASRWLGRPFIARYGGYVGLGSAKLALAEAWSGHYGWFGVFFSRLLPVVRHLIGIPAGILRMDFRWYALSTLLGSLLWCSVLAWLGSTLGDHPDVLKGSLHRFALLVTAAVAVLALLYYFFVKRPLERSKPASGV